MGRITLALSLLLVVGCARLEPPAPIIDRSQESASFTRSATGLLTRLVSLARPATDVVTTPVPVKAEPGQQVAAALPKAPKTTHHTVRSGDTVYKIARLYDIPAHSIIGANQLKAPYMLRVGQRLTIPAGNRHIIAKGDTLYSVARRYDVGLRELAKLNNLHLPYRLHVGQSLAIPQPEKENGPALAAKLPPATGTQTAAIPLPKLRPAELKLARGPKPRIRPNVPSRLAATSTRVIGAPPPRSGHGFAWPVKGKLLTSFGPLDGGRRNEGVNIGAPRGTPVHAAENGVVAYAGNEIRGFGNLVLVKHAGGVITAYAHAEALLVRRGDVVKRGQIIARVGSTGGVSAPQLHFEIRKGANAVDPAELLSS